MEFAVVCKKKIKLMDLVECIKNANAKSELTSEEQDHG